LLSVFRQPYLAELPLFHVSLPPCSKQDKPAHFKPQQAKKVMILGLLALVGNTPDAALPAEIAAGLPQLLSGLVRLLMDLKAQQDRAAEAAEEEEEEEPDEEVRRCCFLI
jgi:hypothetical protein